MRNQNVVLLVGGAVALALIVASLEPTSVAMKQHREFWLSDKPDHMKGEKPWNRELGLDVDTDRIVSKLLQNAEVIVQNGGPNQPPYKFYIYSYKVDPNMTGMSDYKLHKEIEIAYPGIVTS